MRRYKGDILVLISAMCWGSSYLFIQIGLETLSILNLVAARFTTAFILTALVFHRAVRRLGAAGWRYGALLGALLFIGNASLTFGLKNTTISNAGFIIGTTVVFVALLQSILSRRPPGGTLIVGLVLSVCGVGVLSIRSGMAVHFGDLLCLFSAFTFAVHLFIAERAARTTDAIGASIAQFGATAACAWGLAFLVDAPRMPRGENEWFAIVCSSIIGTATGFICQFVGQKYTTPTRTAFLFTLEPFFAVLFAYLFANEALTARTFAGGGLLLAGVYVSEYGKGGSEAPSEPLK